MVKTRTRFRRRGRSRCPPGDRIRVLRDRKATALVLHRGRGAPPRDRRRRDTVGRHRKIHPRRCRRRDCSAFSGVELLIHVLADVICV